jgi:hypothetical protein
MRLGGTDREQEGNHVHLERDQIYSVIPSAVGMIAETDFGRGEVHNYWPAQRMFSVLIFGEQQNVLRELNEDQVWTPLAKYVPVAEVISDKGTLKDWKQMFKVILSGWLCCVRLWRLIASSLVDFVFGDQTIFGNLEEARDRMMEMSRRYFGIDYHDLRNKDMSMRMLFDKVIAHMHELANDEDLQREFVGAFCRDLPVAFALTFLTHWQCSGFVVSITNHRGQQDALCAGVRPDALGHHGEQTRRSELGERHEQAARAADRPQ